MPKAFLIFLICLTAGVSALAQTVNLTGKVYYRENGNIIGSDYFEIRPAFVFVGNFSPSASGNLDTYQFVFEEMKGSNPLRMWRYRVNSSGETSYSTAENQNPRVILRRQQGETNDWVKFSGTAKTAQGKVGGQINFNVVVDFQTVILPMGAPNPSLVGTSINLPVRVIGGGVEEVVFDAALKNNSEDAVEARLIVDGEVVQQGNIGSGVTTEMNFSDWKEQGHEGNYDWQVRNPQTGQWQSMGGGSYSTSRPASGDMPAYSGRGPSSLQASFGPKGTVKLPSASPTPIPTPTPIPESTPIPGPTPRAPGPTPPPFIGGPGGGPNGELTRNDIYEGVKSALQDAMEHVNLGSGKELGTDGDPDPAEGLDKLDGLGVDTEEAIDGLFKGAEHVAGVLDGLISGLEGIPNSFGSVNTINLGTYSYIGPVNIDLSDWPVSQVRGIALFALRLLLIVLFCRAINYES